LFWFYSLILIFFYLVITLSWHDLAAKPTFKALGSCVAARLEALGPGVAANPLKLESCKFNIIINIKNIIICIINIIIFIIMNIANIIINKFKKYIINIEKQP
jgi:Na+/melibiose symporter-like transporter